MRKKYKKDKPQDVADFYLGIDLPTAREMAFMNKTTQKVFRSDSFTKEDLISALYLSFRRAKKGKRRTRDEIRFEADLGENIENLADTIINQTYRPSRGIAFIVRLPVIREIFAAPFRDRVVHHLLYLLNYEWYDRRFIGNSFSCREGKGTLYGQRHIQIDMRRCSKMGKVPAYICKFDISGYFMSLKRTLLYKCVQDKLQIQFKNAPRLRRMAEFLWKQVIFDDPTRDVQIRGAIKDWRKLPRNKSLFTQEPGTGIVIGNLTSQLLSNIFLDQLDRYVRFTLGYKYYGRYVDDFYIVVTEADLARLLKDVPKIRAFLKTLGLKMHKRKCYVQPVEHGVSFLGARVYLRHIQPGKRVMTAFTKVAFAKACGAGVPDDTVNSYAGIFTHFQADRKVGRMIMAAERHVKNKEDQKSGASVPL